MPTEEKLTRRCKGWYEETHKGVDKILYDAGPDADVSDGICPECLEAMEREIENLDGEGK